MKIGLMNNPRLPLYEQLAAFGENQFDFVDLTIEGPTFTLDISRVRTLLEQHDLGIVGHTDPCLPWAYPVASVRDACFKELQRNARIFADLGARIMNIHPCYASPPSMKNNLVKQNLESIKPLVGMAGDLGLKLVLENFKAPFDSVSVFQYLLANAPGLRLHLDVGHTHMGQDATEAFCRALGKEIAHVHLSDNRGTDDHHMPLGAGNIDWPKAIQSLKETGYDGTITLEVFCGSQAVMFSYLETSRMYVRDLWTERMPIE